MLSDLQNQLLLDSTSASEWLSRFEDGGILNYVFVAYPNVIGVGRFDYATNLTTRAFLEDMFYKMFFNYVQASNVLSALPSELGGGPLEVKQAELLYRRYPVLLILGFTVLALLIVAMVSMFVISTWRLCAACCLSGPSVHTVPQYPLTQVLPSPDKSTRLYDINEAFCGHERSLSTLNALTHSSSSFNDPLFTYLTNGEAGLRPIDMVPYSKYKPAPAIVSPSRTSYLILTVVTALTLLILLFMLCITFEASDTVVDTIREENGGILSTSSQKLVPLLRDVVNNTIAFLKESVSGGRMDTVAALSVVDGVTNSSLQSSLNLLIVDLTTEYKVKQLIDLGLLLQEVLIILKTAMDIIRVENQVTSATITTQIGVLTAYANQLDFSFASLCAKDMGMDLNNRCHRLQSQVVQLRISFEADKIEVEPPAVLNFLITQFGIDLASLLDSITLAQDSLEQVEAEVYAAVLKSLDLQTIFASIVNIWTTADEELIPLEQTLLQTTDLICG